MERLYPHATVSGKDSIRGAASNAYHDRGDGHPLENCQSNGFPNASSHSTNRSKPTILCDDQGLESVQRIQHRDVLCWDEGCNRQAEAGPLSWEGEIDLFCSAHQSSAVITTMTQHCQFTGCFNIPKYGQQKGPLRFCHQHKRAGMYTNRNGQLLVATRDGSAFKDEDGTEAVSAATSTNNFAIRKEIQYNVTGDNTTGFGNTGGESNAPSESKSLQKSSEAGLQGSVEPVRLESSHAQDMAISPTAGIMVATPQYRKMCEVTGCRIQPSYGPSGTSRPRFCSSHKTEGMVGLKNRPCIFPGCSTRPHYGLLGCRPIYCSTHKEANMVHLLKEATTRERMGVTRDLGQATRTPSKPYRPESKRLWSVTRSKEEKIRQKVPKNTATFQVEDHQELDSRKGADDVSRPPPQQQKKKEAGKSGTECRRKKASTSTSIPAPSSKSAILAQMAPVSAQVMAPIKTGDPGNCGKASEASPTLSEKTPCSRLPDSLDMTPSFEMQVLEDIRESTHAEATTSGPGKRGRVPSRKALEASGKLKNEGIQWLTKEKKEEEAQRMKEIRAQRKAAAAVGLKAGQVIEAATIGPKVGGESPGTGGNDVGDIAKTEPTKMMWRKLSPAEILEVAGRKSTTNVIDKARPGGRGQSASGVEEADNNTRKEGAKDATNGTSGEKCRETAWTRQITARAITPKCGTTCPQDAKRQKKSHGGQSAQIRQAMPSSDKSDRKETRKVAGWGSTGRYAGTVGAGEVGEIKVCQFEDCSKRATFGVNGIVRYCKLHALFGMHRINIPT